MSTPPFDPSIRRYYGELGDDTAQKMYESLSNHSLSFSFDQSTKIFTILESSSLNKKQLENIFDEKNYSRWRPAVLNAIDPDGNHLVKLENNTASRIIPFEEEENAQDHDAAQLMNDLESLGVSFNGATCIDIGCRSGENSIAMQEKGATVIGIDPDNTDFKTAVAKGMSEEQLIGLALEEYRQIFPDNKFDIATVFLWDIPYEEIPFFITALKEIIQPNGVVIIGYADETYNTSINLTQLMRKHFRNVENTKFDQSRNQHLLKCWNPRL